MLQLSNRNPSEHAHVISPTTLPVSSNGDQNNIVSVLAKQNEITALLVQQQCLSSMPKKDIQVFDGDPLQYQTFIKSFEHSIENNSKNPRDCLYYLEQYTRGQPRELVKSCLHMTSDRGFRKLNLYFRSILDMSIKLLQLTWRRLYHGHQ